MFMKLDILAHGNLSSTSNLRGYPRRAIARSRGWRRMWSWRGDFDEPVRILAHLIFVEYLYNTRFLAEDLCMMGNRVYTV